MFFFLPNFRIHPYCCLQLQNVPSHLYMLYLCIDVIAIKVFYSLWQFAIVDITNYVAMDILLHVFKSTYVHISCRYMPLRVAMPSHSRCLHSTLANILMVFQTGCNNYIFIRGRWSWLLHIFDIFLPLL